MLFEARSRGNKMKNHRKDVGLLLVEKIRAIVGPGYSVTMVRERPWASITFSGTRHGIVISRLAQGEMDLLLSCAEKLAGYDFDLPSHFVADVLVDDLTAQGDAIALEILTISDPVASPRGKI